MTDKITFSFGKNWQNFLKSINEERIENAKSSIAEFFNVNNLEGKSFLDIGCGSGLFSYAAFLLGAKNITSFDVDPFSIECCKYFHKEAGCPKNWIISQGSVLDNNFLSGLGKFDIAYSFGVLHHTGKMWEAIKNSARLVNLGGYFYLVIYNKGKNYKFWLKIKKLYNRLPSLGKYLMEFLYVSAYFAITIIKFKNPFKEIENFNSNNLNRGMDWKTDIIDWLGGYPYEPATAEEIFVFMKKNFPDFNLINLKTANNSSGNWFLFQKNNNNNINT